MHKYKVGDTVKVIGILPNSGPGYNQYLGKTAKITKQLKTLYQGTYEIDIGPENAVWYDQELKKTKAFTKNETGREFNFKQ